MLENFPGLMSGEEFLATGVTAVSAAAALTALAALFLALIALGFAAFAAGNGLKTGDASFSEFSDTLFHVFVCLLLLLLYLPSNTTYMLYAF